MLYVEYYSYNYKGICRCKLTSKNEAEENTWGVLMLGKIMVLIHHRSVFFVLVHDNYSSLTALSALRNTSAVGTGPLPTWQSNTKHYNFCQNLIKFVYETNSTFVTWNTHINFMGIN